MGAAQLSSRTESEKVGGGARILKYGRPPAVDANPGACAKLVQASSCRLVGCRMHRRRDLPC
jgi:hypothetical protein